jgi:hypothetical protein
VVLGTTKYNDATASAGCTQKWPGDPRRGHCAAVPAQHKNLNVLGRYRFSASVHSSQPATPSFRSAVPIAFADALLAWTVYMAPIS